MLYLYSFLHHSGLKIPAEYMARNCSIKYSPILKQICLAHVQNCFVHWKENMRTILSIYIGFKVAFLIEPAIQKKKA